MENINSKLKLMKIEKNIRSKDCSGKWKEVKKNIIQLMLHELMIVYQIIYMNMNLNAIIIVPLEH